MIQNTCRIPEGCDEEFLNIAEGSVGNRFEPDVVGSFRIVEQLFGSSEKVDDKCARYPSIFIEQINFRMFQPGVGSRQVIEELNCPLRDMPREIPVYGLDVETVDFILLRFGLR